MQVVVKLFALYRELIGTSQVCIELPDSAVVGDLCRELRRCFPALPQEPYQLVVAVDMIYVDDDYLLQEGQEAALIPPVSGGVC